MIRGGSPAAHPPTHPHPHPTPPLRCLVWVVNPAARAQKELTPSAAERVWQEAASTAATAAAGGVGGSQGSPTQQQQQQGGAAALSAPPAFEVAYVRSPEGAHRQLQRELARLRPVLPHARVWVFVCGGRVGWLDGCWRAHWCCVGGLPCRVMPPPPPPPPTALSRTRPPLCWQGARAWPHRGVGECRGPRCPAPRGPHAGGVAHRGHAAPPWRRSSLPSPRVAAPCCARCAGTDAGGRGLAAGGCGWWVGMGGGWVWVVGGWVWVVGGWGGRMGVSERARD